MLHFLKGLAHFFEKIFYLFEKGHAIEEKARDLQSTIEKGDIAIKSAKEAVIALKQEIKEKHPDKYEELHKEANK